MSSGWALLLIYVTVMSLVAVVAWWVSRRRR